MYSSYVVHVPHVKLWPLVKESLFLYCKMVPVEWQMAAQEVQAPATHVPSVVPGSVLVSCQSLNI